MKKAFTIVELIIVIVIVGILAAISILMYSGVQRQATETALKSDLKQASTQLAADYALNGTYPGDESGIARSSGTRYEYSVDATSYCLTGTSTRSGVLAYHVSNTSGAVSSGPCEGHSGESGGGDESGPELVLAYGFNESSGTTFSPSAGSAVGTIGEGATFTSGVHGNALLPAWPQLAGTVTGASVPSMAGMSAVTVMIDVSPHSRPAFPVVFYSGSDDFLGLEIDHVGASRWWIGSSLMPFSATTVNTATWSHHAVTWDGTTARSYVNGVLQQEMSVSSGLANPTTLRFGNATWNSATSTIDNFRIYNQALTAAQIQTIRNQGV